MVGELHQCAQVCAQVGFTSNQQHLGVGAELLDLPFPLWTNTNRSLVPALSKKGKSSVTAAHNKVPTHQSLEFENHDLTVFTYVFKKRKKNVGQNDQA